MNVGETAQSAKPLVVLFGANRQAEAESLATCADYLNKHGIAASVIGALTAGLQASWLERCYFGVESCSIAVFLLLGDGSKNSASDLFEPVTLDSDMMKTLAYLVKTYPHRPALIVLDSKKKWMEFSRCYLKMCRSLGDMRRYYVGFPIDSPSPGALTMRVRAVVRAYCVNRYLEMGVE